MIYNIWQKHDMAENSISQLHQSSLSIANKFICNPKRETVRKS